MGLVVGVFIRRAHWLIVPGLLATGGAVVAHAVDGLGVHLGVPFDSGRSFEVIRDGSEIHDLDIGAGERTFQIETLTGDADLDARVGVGVLNVGVPRTARVSVTSRVGIGEIDTPGTNVDGYRRVATSTFGPEGGERLDLDLRVGLGRIHVYVVESVVTIDEIPPITAPAVGEGFGDSLATIPRLPPGASYGDADGTAAPEPSGTTTIVP